MGKFTQTDTPSIAYCDYFATGEGRTLIVAIGCSAIHAEKVFKEYTDPYFHIGMVVVQLDDQPNDLLKSLLKLIPKRVLKLIKAHPPGTTEYYGRLHYNLS